MSKQSAKADILIVDDTPSNLHILTSHLSRHGYHIRAATDGQLALMAAHSQPPDLILLDVMMPGMNGYEVCQKLKEDTALQDIPVIFVSALGETVDKVEGFRAGGVDYISKPYHIQEVLARINTHLTLYHQRRKLEQTREQDRQYFEKLSQLKDEFLGMASHDLKNPLTNIKLATDLLKQRGDDNTFRERYIQMIEQQIERMQFLITNILDFVKLETGRALVYEKVLISDFLINTLEEFSLRAREKQITLQFESVGGDIQVLFDPDQMTLALNNLLSNAIKYTAAGGLIKVIAEQQADYLLIHVIDNGIGIPEQDIPYLFDKFYRVKNKAHMAIEGTGLGLSIAKSIIDQHGGHIWVESILGEGSKFHIALSLQQ